MFAAALACLVLLAAGCGGGSNGPSVANLGTTSTATTHRSAAVQPLSPQEQTATLDAYVACLDAHGVQARVAPGGGIEIEQGPGTTDQSSSTSQAAAKACQKVLPKGGLPGPAQSQITQRRQQSLRFATCMRTHGVPGFPDPNSGGGFDIGSNTDSGVDPSSPTYQAADRACGNYLTAGG